MQSLSQSLPIAPPLEHKPQTDKCNKCKFFKVAVSFGFYFIDSIKLPLKKKKSACQIRITNLRFHSRNIYYNLPSDQLSRWSSDSNNPPQVCILYLQHWRFYSCYQYQKDLHIKTHLLSHVFLLIVRLMTDTSRSLQSQRSLKYKNNHCR